MDYNQNTIQEQSFQLSPFFALGTHIKLLFIGKPSRQSTDQKYYIALAYVGVCTSEAPQTLQGIV